MASFPTADAGSAMAQTMNSPQNQQQQQQQQQQQPQLSPLQQQQQQQQQQQSNLQPQFVQASGPPANDLSPAARSSSSANSNALNLGLGFLRGFGFDKKTNRDGQPPKRRGPKPDSKPALTRRQELNRQAQRTHRQRKEVYIKSLEDQVMHLKELYTSTVQDRNVYDEENRRLRDLLRFHGIQIPPEMMAQMAQHGQLHSDGNFSSNLSASDGGMGQSASDYATPSSYHASGSDAGGPAGTSSALSVPSDGTPHHAHQQYLSSQQGPQQPQQAAKQPPQSGQLIRGTMAENQLGIDFVLALEAFCRDHQQYLCVRSSQSVESAEPVASGHALMLSCPPSSHIQQNPSEQYPHQPPSVPAASLASLLNTARQLPWVGDGEITPIMALNLIQLDERYPLMTVSEFVAVQRELEEKTRCYGFGAVLEEFEVRDALENIFSNRSFAN